jgi:hypothetical protein
LAARVSHSLLFTNGSAGLKAKTNKMARRHRLRRFRIPKPYGWDFDGLSVVGWLTVAAAVIVSVAIVWAAM